MSTHTVTRTIGPAEITVTASARVIPAGTKTVWVDEEVEVKTPAKGVRTLQIAVKVGKDVKVSSFRPHRMSPEDFRATKAAAGITHVMPGVLLRTASAEIILAMCDEAEAAIAGTPEAIEADRLIAARKAASEARDQGIADADAHIAAVEQLRITGKKLN